MEPSTEPSTHLLAKRPKAKTAGNWYTLFYTGRPKPIVWVAVSLFTHTKNEPKFLICAMRKIVIQLEHFLEMSRKGESFNDCTHKLTASTWLPCTHQIEKHLSMQVRQENPSFSGVTSSCYLGYLGSGSSIQRIWEWIYPTRKNI